MTFLNSFWVILVKNGLKKYFLYTKKIFKNRQNFFEKIEMIKCIQKIGFLGDFGEKWAKIGKKGPFWAKIGILPIYYCVL